MTSVLTAGRSQAQEALRARLRIAEYERLLADEQDRLRRHEIAARTERHVAATLTAMSVWGWRTLVDRRWPGKWQNANVDILHVGPGGVVVVDVKAWRAARVVAGRLWRGDVDASDDVQTLLRITELVEDALTPLGLAPIQVEPVVVLAGRRHAPTRLGRAVVLGEPDVVPWLNRRAPRLSEAEVDAVTEALAAAFPPYDVRDNPRAGVATLDPVLPRRRCADEQLELLDVAELESSLLEAELAKPIEQWMTILHPDQHAAVRRVAKGPSRVRGPAGTGKTVVALHRAAYLAATGEGALLYTSYVRTLPTALRSLYEVLSPATADRVEFVGVHAWALRFLRSRGVRVSLDPATARTLFNRTWASLGRYSVLARLPVHPDYWYDEVTAVVKGRGLTDYGRYATLQRIGRRMPLRAEQRAAVWDLHEAYDVALREAGIHDFADVLTMALGEVRQRPLDEPYAAVFVDEAQDLTSVAVQLMREIAGADGQGLHLIGDGRQSVYPGGYSLAELGIDVRGRSTVLRTNYRNCAEVLETAAAVVAGDDFDDLEGPQESDEAVSPVSPVRTGGRTTRVDADDVPSHDAALLAALASVDHGTTALGDCAVLTRTEGMASKYREVLRAAGFQVVDLKDYAGQTCDGVKVGTIKRAKGLEFKQVLLPRVSDTPPPQSDDEPDAAYVERAALWRRELYVGMTRARDGLWLGYVRSRNSPADCRG